MAVKSVYLRDASNKSGTFKVVEINLTNGKKRQLHKPPGTKDVIAFMTDRIKPEVYELIADHPSWDPSMM